MPYYIGDVIKDEKRLVARTPEKFRETGVDVRLEVRAEEIDKDKKTVRLSDGTIAPYDILVLGTGTTAVVPKVPGVELEGVFILKTLPDAIRIKAYLREKRCRKAIIVGAGFIGLEMCEALRTLEIDTQVIDLVSRPAMRWDPEFSNTILEELTRQKVTFLPNTGMTSIVEGKDHRLRLKTNNGEMEADMILIAIGVRPNAKLAVDAGLQIGKSGAIQVDFSQRTSGEGIYAVGDCCEVYHRVSRKWVHIPLGDIANKQGRVAGLNIGGGSMIFPGVVGAQSFKIFNLGAAAAGIDETEAKNSGYHPVSTVIWGNAIARSMPGEKRLGIKLVADRATGMLLGAQAVGTTGAVERINTLSCALWNGMGLDEIAYLDFAYSPPFSPAWDPIHIAAQELIRKL
ncbi:MAG: FAD-dependent oxidoreductase [Deltaproteobacteria bacterium]|nr:FAD-dependent oxidoreductase [Deltaproteobacteria bacterium]